jgi:hypothetical protein
MACPIIHLKDPQAPRRIGGKNKGMFGSQPHFAKPNFGCHSFIGRCLVLATLWRVIFYFSYDPLVIELLFLPILTKFWLQIF